MMHSLLSERFPTILCIINFIIQINELNYIVNTNPLIASLTPVIIRPYMSQSQQTQRTNRRLLRSGIPIALRMA